jgi:uncharacterized protein
MRFAFLVCALLLSSCGSRDGASELRALDERWSAAAAKNDLAATLAFYAADAVLLPPNAPLAKDGAAIRASWAELLGPNTAVSWKVSKAEVAQSGELGYLYGTYQLTIKDPKTGAVVRDTGKLVEVWKKQADGQWKCVVDTYNSDIPVAAASASASASASAGIGVLVIDGVNNHDWAAGTVGIRAVLAEAGGFRVDVATVKPETFAQWKPDFGQYQVVVSNFNGGHLDNGIRWPERVEKQLEAYVRGGGGFVSYHAANNAFLHWAAYNDMIGLGWRDPDFGPGLAVSDAGKVVTVPRGTGLKPGHPVRGDFVVHVLDHQHPITRGLPDQWRQPMEQLTHGQHGPARGLTILTYAHSPVSGKNEPMDWARRYGQGRVYVTMLGHTWKGEANPNLETPEFRKLLAQGIRWAATGE